MLESRGISSGKKCSRGLSHTLARNITGLNRIRLVLFDMNNRILRPYLAAIYIVLISATERPGWLQPVGPWRDSELRSSNYCAFGQIFEHASSNWITRRQQKCRLFLDRFLALLQDKPMPHLLWSTAADSLVCQRELTAWGPDIG
jgi:hypothetical protein